GPQRATDRALAQETDTPRKNAMKKRTVRLEFTALEDRHGIIDGLALARALIAEAHKLLVPYAGPDAPCGEIFEILMGQAFTDNLADGMPSIVMPAEHGLPDYE